MQQRDTQILYPNTVYTHKYTYKIKTNVYGIILPLRCVMSSILFHFGLVYFVVLFYSVLLWEIEEERGCGRWWGNLQSPHKTPMAPGMNQNSQNQQNLENVPQSKPPGFTGEESAAHAQAASCCSFVKSIFNPFLLDSLALGSGVLRVLSTKS